MVAAMASCTDDYTDWASPQQNAEGASFNVTLSVEAAPAIDFATLTEQTVALFKPTVTISYAGESGNSYIDKQNTTYDIVVWNADKSDSRRLVTSDGMIEAADLETAVTELYGKRPELHKLALDIKADTNIDGVGILNTASTVLDVTLKAPYIDAAYYLTGDMAGWNKEGALPFTHLGSGDVYDNPEFQIVFTTTADNQYWKIIPGVNYDGDFWAEGNTGVVGTTIDGDTSFEGSLTTTAPQAGKIEQAGIYRMTINMMNYTYRIERLEFQPFVYFIGATDGWSAPDQKLGTETFDGKYTGYVYIADPNGWGLEFKFQKRPGDWADDSQLNSNNMNTVSGDFVKTGDNFKANAGEGVYFVELDLAAGSLKGTYINNMNLVGDYNGWNAGDASQQMTWNPTEFCYEISGAAVTANGWKFTANDAWDINLGGSVGNLVANGDNLSVVGTTIKLYPTRKTSDNIYCTVE